MSMARTGLSDWERTLNPKWRGRDTFTVPEAAEILGISRGAAYEAVKKKQLPAIRLGRRCLVPRRALERMLEGVG
jgi:excisionase family DNA binding protein